VSRQPVVAPGERSYMTASFVVEVEVIYVSVSGVSAAGTESIYPFELESLVPRRTQEDYGPVDHYTFVVEGDLCPQ
jgi:hypothetical protein